MKTSKKTSKKLMIFLISLFTMSFYSRSTEASSQTLAPMTARTVECSVDYVDFINTDGGRISHSLYAPTVSLKANVARVVSEHPFVKTTYSSRCQRCGPSMTLGPIKDPSSAFKEWVSSTEVVKENKVRIEVERVLDTQPYEILSLRITLNDVSESMTMTALDKNTTVMLRTMVNQTPGVISVNCRVGEPR